MKKRMVIMLIAMIILFGGIFAYKSFGKYMMMKYFASQGNPVVTVSAMTIKKQDWQPLVRAVGNVRAIQGVNVTTSLAGQVEKIYFTPGATVKTGDLLVQLNADAELGQLHALEAQLQLANITLKRDTSQLQVKAISQAAVDSDTANQKNLSAQVEQQKAIVNKKFIRAPFNGRLGISRINLGQYLNVGDPIVSLQMENPIYIDFYVPQQTVPQIAVGQTANFTTDAFLKTVFSGKLTTVNPSLDSATRNVEVEATVPNTDHLLKPGMFVSVAVQTGTPKAFLTLPQSAISFNSYGDLVYVVKEEGKDANGKSKLVAHQAFVTTGEKRGNQISILTGIKEGDLIVTSGQLKLKNGSLVVIDNSNPPSDNPTPDVDNEHEAS